MEREEVFEYVDQKYQTKPEYLWRKYPKYSVLRHQDNRKWYGLVMDVKPENLGVDEKGTEDVMDIKLKPEQIDVLQEEAGILPAYHMNKTHWVSIRLNKVSDTEIHKLIDASYLETKK